MAGAYYLRPDRLMTCGFGALGTDGATVTGTVAASYEAAWLCDNRVQYPVRGPAGSGSPFAADLLLNIVGTSRSCGLAVLANHNLDDSVAAVLSGAISASLVGGTGNRPNLIPWNRWIDFTPVTASSCTLEVADNPEDVIIGELLVGEKFTLPMPPMIGISHDVPQYALPQMAEFTAGNGYDKGMAGGRLLEFAFYCTRTELNGVTSGLRAWEESCRNGTRVSALIPDSDLAEVYVGTMQGFRWEEIGPESMNLFRVTVQFLEFPRTRW